MTPTDDTVGPPDSQALRLLERNLAKNDRVTATAFEPDSYMPRRLRVRLDATQYPGTVDAARLDVRWFTTSDVSIHYVETHADGERWECRWDRHPNDHNARRHFHRPPDGDDTTDISLPSVHPMQLHGVVLDRLEHRIEALWEDR